MNVKFARDEKEIGDYQEDAVPALLRSNVLRLTDLFWCEGMVTWELAGSKWSSTPPPPIEAERARAGAAIARPSIGRLGYFLWMLGIMFVASELKRFAPALTWLLVIPSLVLGALRYRDIGRNPVWALLGLIPIVNLVIGYQLLAHPTDYAQTKESDLPMKLIRGLYIVLMLFFVAVLIPVIPIVLQKMR